MAKTKNYLNDWEENSADAGDRLLNTLIATSPLSMTAAFARLDRLMSKYDMPRMDKQGRGNAADFTRIYLIDKVRPIISKRVSLFMEHMRTFEWIHEEFVKRSKIRARVAGYTFGCLIQNCHGSDFRAVEQVFETLPTPFNYEAELVSDDWIIPLSGSLHDDIRTNFVAKSAKKMDTLQFLDLMQLMLDIITEQYVDCVGSFYERYASVPFFLLDADDPDRLEGSMSVFFSDEPSLDEKIKSNKELYRSLSAIMTACILEDWSAQKQTPDVEEDNENYEEPAWALPDLGNRVSLLYPTFVPYNGSLSLTDRRMVPTSRAMNGFFLSAFYSEEDIPDKDFAYDKHKWAEMIDIHPSAPVVRNFGSNAFAVSLLDRERYEYETQRKALKEKKKTAKAEIKAEKKLNAAQYEAEIARLKEELKQEKEKSAELTRFRIKAEADSQHAKNTSKKKENELSAAQKTITQLESIKNALEAEAEALKVMFEDTPESPVTEKEKLNTGILDNIKVVCYGGFPAWINGMNDIHENVTFYDKSSHMPESAIAAADVVWLQVNHIGHPNFYRIISAAKNLNKPVKYFTHAGHVACRQQMIRETSEMFAKENG